MSASETVEVLNFSSQSLQGSLSGSGVVVVGGSVVVVTVHLEASAIHSSWWLQNWFNIIMLILKCKDVGVHLSMHFL